MLGHNGAILRHNTKWLGEVIHPDYKVYTSVAGEGTATCIATPNHGITGTEVTLSTTDIEEGYQLSGYTVNGATLKNSNQFDIAYSDVNVTANITAINPTKMKYLIVNMYLGVHDYVPNAGSITYTPYNPSSAPVKISNMRIVYDGYWYALTPVNTHRSFYDNYPIYGQLPVRTQLTTEDLSKALKGNGGLTIPVAHTISLCYYIPDELNRHYPNSSDCAFIEFDIDRSGSRDYYGNMPSSVDDRQRKLNNFTTSLFAITYASVNPYGYVPDFDYADWSADPRWTSDPKDPYRPWRLINYRGESYQASFTNFGVPLYGL
jgi:hypothetical protein